MQMASNDILPSIPWVAVHALHSCECVRRSRLNCVEQLPRLLSYQARQSAKDHHFARPRVSPGQITPALQQIYPQIMTKVAHCRAICLSWLCILAKWINSSLSSSTLTISSAYRRILVLLKSLASALPLSVAWGKIIVPTKIRVCKTTQPPVAPCGS